MSEEYYYIENRREIHLFLGDELINEIEIFCKNYKKDLYTIINHIFRKKFFCDYFIKRLNSRMNILINAYRNENNDYNKKRILEYTKQAIVKYFVKRQLHPTRIENRYDYFITDGHLLDDEPIEIN